MALFSQRKGLRPMQKALQFESIDEELRNRLWSALKIAIWDNWSPEPDPGFRDPKALLVESFIKELWLNYFKRPIDTIPAFHYYGGSYGSGPGRSSYEIIRKHFFQAPYNEVYDFLEFAVKHAPNDWGEKLRNFVNRSLEQENAAYRFVNSEIVEITDKEEIATIEEASSCGVRSISEHSRRALELLSDRKSRDYRNSIKESISAVEAASRVVAGKGKDTLGDCLGVIDKAHGLHPALKQAFLKLYGFTSDSGGIRHALTESEPAPTYADAKFMLVACTAFTNFLLTKAAELKIPIK
jgi:AbiJ N-terminal domain 4